MRDIVYIYLIIALCVFLAVCLAIGLGAPLIHQIGQLLAVGHL